MNDVLSGHDELYFLTHRHVKFIYLALTGSVLELPHPLFAHDVDFEGISGGAILREINLGPPDKYGHRDQQGND
jgi:hypothetical protein